MELLAYWKIVRKRLALIILLALIGPSAAVFYTLQTPPRYRTSTTLFLNPAAASALLPYQSTKTVESVANTYIEFMRTRSFAGLVARQSGLSLSPDQILRMIATEFVPNTQFFRIIATAGDPQTAQALANTAAKVLIDENTVRQQAEQAQIQSQHSQNPEVQQLSDLRDALKSALANHNQQIASLQEQIAGMEARAPSERNDERLKNLREELIAEQTARAQALTSLAQAQSTLVSSGGAGAGSAPDTAVVVDPAPLPEPLPSQLVERALLALVLSLGVGVGIAFALEYLDYTAKTPEALDAAYGQATLGVIATLVSRRIRGGPHPSYQLTASDPLSPTAESIRALRTGVEVAQMIEPVRSLLVTSAGPAEGKTFVAANLAVSLAQNGNRVILVDADLRKPSLHTAFDLPRDPGFTNLVVDQASDPVAAIRPRLRAIYARARNREALKQYIAEGQGRRATLRLSQMQRLLDEIESDDPEVLEMVAEVRRLIEPRDKIAPYLRRTNVENLWLLPAGVIPPQPAELLGSPRAAQVMELLGEHADIVIYDSPPAATVTDAVVIAPRVDAMLQVVRAGKTRIDLVRRCKAVLKQANPRLLGAVLNQVRQPDLGYHSNYYDCAYYHQNGRKGANGRNGHNGHRKGEPLVQVWPPAELTNGKSTE